MTLTHFVLSAGANDLVPAVLGVALGAVPQFSHLKRSSASLAESLKHRTEQANRLAMRLPIEASADGENWHRVG
jgi:hypothetical protein